MHIATQQLREVLVSSGLIAETDFNAVEKESKRLDKDIVEVILGKGLIQERYLVEIISDYLNVPIYKIRGKDFPKNFTLIPESLAKSKNIFLLKIKDNEMALVGMLDPTDYITRNFVEGRLGIPLEAALITPSDLDELLKLYKQNIGVEFKEIIEQHAKAVAGIGKKAEMLARELPVITILDLILDHAIATKASDIHIEPEEENVLVRYRIDGILHDVVELPGLVHSALIARLKILSNLAIDEHRVPQDGRFNIKKVEDEVAVRVSIMPTFHGEKAALRVLISSHKTLNFSELGIEGRNEKIVSSAIKKKSGLLVVSGPTGSGKTTTLYTILGLLNKPEVNIATIEDPIEYDIARVNQTQVNVRTGLTFAEALRSFLRQNPDIMMVGEIRDKETAELAVHASLTGHLILSTLHTDDAPTAIPRLLDLGVEPFLLASTLRTVIAQRLVRRICPDCVKGESISEQTLTILREQLSRINKKYRSKDVAIERKLYIGAGCVSCGNLGYKGLIGIFEVLDISPRISELIMQNVSADKIKEVAFEEGFVSIFEDGLRKAERGLTTVDEVLRVVRS